MARWYIPSQSTPRLYYLVDTRTAPAPTWQPRLQAAWKGASAHVPPISSLFFGRSLPAAGTHESRRFTVVRMPGRLP
jgi:hypothetical protein